jgi:hypothetical protein
MSIYIAFHKESPILSNDPIYCPVHVGKALSQIDLNMTSDDLGDNISWKNKSYSELTGLYWVWKNTTDSIVGLSHYRRFFFSKEPILAMKLKKVGEYLIGQGNKRFGVYYTSCRENSNLILSGDETLDLLKNYDAIIPVSRKMRYTVREQYQRRHFIKDLENTGKIIQEKYSGYISTFNMVMQKKEILPCNMFIMKREHFNNYMTWLFEILFELEKTTDISEYDTYQKRIFGFLSERLLDVWITKNQLETKKLPVIYFKKLKEI